MTIRGNRGNPGRRGGLAHLLLGGAAALTLAAGSAQAQTGRVAQVDIPAQSLSSALTRAGRQTGTEIIFAPSIVRGLRASTLRGNLTVEQALERLLSGTGLTFRRTAQGAIVVEAATGEAQAGGAAADDESADELIIVTGTNVRGRGPVGSPLSMYNRDDFNRAGASTAQEFMATIPQNYGGGASEAGGQSPVNRTNNPAFGSGVNLRGLGQSSTLTLINGQRSALSGDAEFVDISMIPLSAVERIEILTDGASAIYGSDAVAGVVNFILRRDYSGAETTVRAGTTTRGGGEQLLLGQNFGRRWSTGGILLAYEFNRRRSLNTEDRDFTATAGPIDLEPSQRRHSVYASVNQSLGSWLRLTADALYSKRHVDFLGYDPFTPEANFTTADTSQLAASLGADIDLPSGWDLSLGSSFSRNKTFNVLDTPSRNFGSGPIQSVSQYRVSLSNAILRGELFDLPTGPIRVALGGSYRYEWYQFFGYLPDFDLRFPEGRNVGTFDSLAGFGEIVVPVLGRADAPILTLSAAARYEDYSTFGSSFDPKLGLSLRAGRFVTLRASYGTSYRIPSLQQLNEFNQGGGASNRADSQSPTGSTRAITRSGNNAGLRPEFATTWTAGADFSVPGNSGFRAGVTYFDIDYRDRIRDPGIGSVVALNNPIYADLVLRRGEVPDADFDALVREIYAALGPNYLGCTLRDPSTGICSDNPATIGAIIDLRLTNLAKTRERGIDIDISQAVSSRSGDFTLAANISYLFERRQQLTPGGSLDNVLSRIGTPVRFRARATAGWTRDGLSASVALNYYDNYTTEGVTSSVTSQPLPVQSISDWATIDLNFQYEAGQAGPLRGFAAGLNILNLFDRDPPSVDDGFLGLGYDPANANARGRVVSIFLRKQW